MNETASSSKTNGNRSSIENLFSVGVKAKLFGLILGTATLSLLAACIAFVVYDRDSYSSSKKATLTVLADSIADGAYGPVAFGDEESATYILKTIGSERTALMAGVYLSDGARLALWTREGENRTLPDEWNDPVGRFEGTLTLVRPIAKDDEQVGRIVAIFSTRDIEERTRQFVRLAGSVLLGAFLLATLVVLVAHRVFTTPIKELSDAVHRVENEGRFDIRVKPHSRDELGRLTRAFNEMLSAIESRDEELKIHRETLEQQVAERTRDLDRKNRAMRLVLDTVEEGLVTLDRDGMPLSERSARFDDWFAHGQEHRPFAQLVATQVTGFDARFEVAYDQVTDGLLPPEITLDQLPKEMVTNDGRSFSLQYRPVFEGENLTRVLVILRDRTDELTRERAEQKQRQVLSMFEQINKDRGGFVEFLHDADEMVKTIVDETWADRGEALRVLHTLKGNCSIFELHAMAKCCHSIENHCVEPGATPGQLERQLLADNWNDVAQRARQLLGDVSESLVVDLSDYDEVLTTARLASPNGRLTRMLERLAYDPAQPKLDRFSTQTERLATRLGIQGLKVTATAHQVRLPEGWSWLFNLVPHLLRNAVDHGLRESGQSEPQIELSLIEEHGELRVCVSDNGRGIDWDRLAQVAEEKGLPTGTKQQLVRVLFADEVTTKAEASDISGRGVGMAAVAKELRSRGGCIEVASEPGQGTSFTLIVPFSDNPAPASRASIIARSLLPPSVGIGRSSAS